MEINLKLSEQICFPIYLLSREIINKYRPILKRLDITYPQYLVLLVLWEDGTQKVNQLGEKLSLDTGTLTPLLKRLEQTGLITRKRASFDERVVEISLTEKGENLREKALEVPKELAEKINITEEEVLILKQIINKTTKNT